MIIDDDKKINITMEDLREARLISNTDGRPVSSLTDEKWQKEFEIRKLFAKPYSDTQKVVEVYLSKDDLPPTIDDTKYSCYKEARQDGYYSFIKDILSNISNGSTDYCYYIYQIMELLKFYPHNLKTKYCDGYWEVWLDN